ncbi:acidic tetraheme cytochrome c3 TmcA [Desulfoplanes formicivorans]|nr:cytochrome c3 family protein [Desulfoplanes formicivorans]
MGTTNNSDRIHGLGWIPAAMMVLMLAVLALPGMAMAQEDMTMIRSDAFEHHQRPAVRFVHDMHNEMAEIDDCSVCHHVYEDGKLLEGETSEDEPCSSCHPAQPESGELGLMRAFHKRCITCHDETGKGPLTCGGCHVKN